MRLGSSNASTSVRKNPYRGTAPKLLELLPKNVNDVHAQGYVTGQQGDHRGSKTRVRYYELTADGLVQVNGKSFRQTRISNQPEILGNQVCLCLLETGGVRELIEGCNGPSHLIQDCVRAAHTKSVRFLE